MCVLWEQENKNKMKQKTTIKTEGGVGGGREEKKTGIWLKQATTSIEKP